MVEQYKLAGFSSVLGAWVVISPFDYSVSGISLWNAVVVGLLITGFGLYHWRQLKNDRAIRTGTVVFAAALGAWLMIAPFLLGSPSSLKWSNVLSGLFVLGINGYNASR